MEKAYNIEIKEKFDFYRKALIHNGFKTIDNIKFTYKLD